MNLDQFLKWFWKYEVAFPTIYFLLSACLNVGVSTTTCEASFSSVMRIPTPHRRCTTHERTGVTRLDSVRGKKQFGATMFESEVFRKQMYWIEESSFGLCLDLQYRRLQSVSTPGIVPPRYAPATV